jgi:hypothetical protein
VASQLGDKVGLLGAGHRLVKGSANLLDLRTEFGKGHLLVIHLFVD